MSALPSISQFAEWLRALERCDSNTESAMAKANIVVAYARAAARTEGLDEVSACLAALDTVRKMMGEEAAEKVAEAQGLELDALLDQEREDNEQRLREWEFEQSVPWGRE